MWLILKSGSFVWCSEKDFLIAFCEGYLAMEFFLCQMTFLVPWKGLPLRQSTQFVLIFDLQTTIYFSSGETPWKFWRGCATQLSKHCPYFRAKYLIFWYLFSDFPSNTYSQTWGPFLESPGNFSGTELYFRINLSMFIPLSFKTNKIWIFKVNLVLMK